MRYSVEFTVYGLPAAQGSKRYVGHRRGADGRERAVLIEQSKRVKPWRKAVADAAVLARPVELLDGPLVADMVFTFARPRSHFGTGRNAGVLKASAPLAPAVAPDLSKLARSTEDALTDAGVWRDDSRVVAYGRLEKVYAGADDPDALDEPGAIIRVRSLLAAPQHTPHIEGLSHDVVQGG
ncbi:hypothetical protein GCM10027447_12690 [Glycomyces halotolerans]